MLHCLTFIFLSMIIGTAQAARVSSSNANETLSEWLNCHPAIPLNMRVQRQCPNCELNQSQESSSVSNITDDVRRSCLPPAEEGQELFSEWVQPAVMVQRDSYICQCLQNGNGGEIENTSFNSGNDSDAHVELLRSTSEAKYTSLYQDELTNRYSNDRLQAAVTTLSYVDNNEDSINLTTPYSLVVAGVTSAASSAVAPTVSTSRSIAQQHLDRQGQYAEVANNEELDAPILQTGTVGRDSNICLPYRHFITHNMFPEDADFYNELNSAEIWNYRKLMEEMFSMEKSAGGREQALNRPRAKRVYSRIKFLHSNPVLKNIFLSNNETVRDQLVEIIRTIPRPVCSSGTCTRDDNWKRLMPDFEKKMAGFLASEGAISASRQGAVISSQLGYEVSEGRARQISIASQSILSAEGLHNAAEWKGYCKALDQLKSRGKSVASYVGDIEKELGVRDFETPEADPDFQNLNDQICSKRRRNPQTNQIDTLNNFLLTTCSSSTTGRCAPEARGVLIAEYLDIYKEAVDQVDERLIADIVPFLQGEVGGPRNLSSRDLKELSVASRDPSRVSAPVRFTSREYADLTPANSASGTNASIAANSSASRSPASSAQQRSPEQFESAGFVAQNDRVMGSSLAAPNASTSEARSPEVLRSTLAVNENESKEIRDQISSLRDVIRDPASATRDSGALQTLTERLASLERRLEAKSRENADLREQIAESEDDREAAPQRTQTQVSSNESRRSSNGVQQNQSAVSAQSQGGVSGGASIAAPGTSGGQASLGSASRISAAARAPGAGGNSALLSKYGVREFNVQGAIVVASTPESADYQSLRSQSENSIIPIAISTAEFDQIAGNNQEALNRYLDQVRAMPGEVVRLSLTAGSDRSMELFVVKNGNEISIVQSGAGRGIASDSQVEAIPTPSRDVTLESLRNELGK